MHGQRKTEPLDRQEEIVNLGASFPPTLLTFPVLPVFQPWSRYPSDEPMWSRPMGPLLQKGSERIQADKAGNGTGARAMDTTGCNQTPFIGDFNFLEGGGE